VKDKAKKSRKRYFYYFVVQKAGSLALRKREGKDIWNGLYDFSLVEKNRAVSIDAIQTELGIKKIDKHGISKIYKHVLSHQIIHATFILVPLRSGIKLSKEFNFYSPLEIAELPKPVLISRFLDDYSLL
jgi:A/G-specific adenine glycosylase